MRFFLLNSGLLKNLNTSLIFQFTTFSTSLYNGHIPINSVQRSILKCGSAIISLLDPSRDDMIAVFGETSGLSALKKLHKLMKNDAVGSQILSDKARIRTDRICLDYLRSLPKNTLGSAYVAFLDHYDYTPDARREVRFVDDVELAYVMQRYREIHDLAHVLLGQPTNLRGEVVVKWVEAYQTNLPLCWTGAFLAPLRFRPKTRQQYLEVWLPYALRVGQKAKPFMCYYFEKNWEVSLQDVRCQLEIEEPPQIVKKT